MKTINLRRKDRIPAFELPNKPGNVSVSAVEPLKNSVVKPIYRYTSDSTPDMRGSEGGGGAEPEAGGSAFQNLFSVDFDGTDDYLTADAGAALRSTDAISFSQWVNLDSIGGTQKVFSLGNTSSLDDRVQAQINIEGQVTAYVKLAGTAKSGNSSTTASVGQWFHYVVTLDNTNGIKIYFNGSLERSVAVSAGYLSNNSNLLQIRMSTRATSLSQFVNGKIDETSVYDKTLSADDVTGIYNDGVPSDLSSYSPVHWWRFGDNDGGTGITLTDQGSAGKNATLINGPIFSTDVPTFSTDVPLSLPTYSVDFDGTDDRIEIPTITEFNAPLAFSTSHWFNYSGTPSNTTHVLMSAGLAGSNRFYIELTSSTNIRYGNDGNFEDITISSVSASNWYNLVTVQNGTSLDVYLNGTKQGATVTVNAPSSGYGSNFLIGAYGAGGSIIGEWQGLLDEVATWDSALSASDITAIYNSGVPADISSLNPVGWWRMGDNDGGTGTTITDQGSGGNDGTLTNGPTFSSSVPS